MKLADSHLHLFRQGYAPRYGTAWANRHEVKLYESFRRAHDIESGLVIGFEGRPEFLGNNGDIAILARKHSWIRPLAFQRTSTEPTVKILEGWHRQGFAGIALYIMSRSDAEHINRWPISVFGWLNEHQQILSINAGPEALAHIGPLLRKLDECATLISHLGLPGRFTRPPSSREAKNILRPLLALAKLPHVGVKLSGLYAISDPTHAYPHRSARPFVSKLYDDIGPKRLYWGSDFSPVLEHISFPQTIDVLFQFNWSTPDLQSIMHDNLMRLIDRAGRRN